MARAERHQPGMNQGRIVTGLALLPLLLAAGLSGCGGTPPPPDLGAVAPPPPAAPGAAPTTPNKPAPASAAIAKAGFTPLPTVQQVEAAMPQGRLDPFAPLAVTRVTRDAGKPRAIVVQPPLTLPDGFRFQGVISSGGRPMALVQFGGQSGSLAVGDAGGRTTDLLPEAWGVASIDVLRGRLTLVSRQGQAKGQVVIAEL
ncbi:hypothetical protein KBY93_11760 [Synechococcus sp. J7-Johnson]|uniref:hypothetical protein n=1 Tax=Synechococcus sp. J7-Johnson TaxID=2823737 RepID=UPI0020CD8F25|nr:hypothetical protein [Synechococcus sp. J7-Johnson]MCP9841303.1 hypothetical protein [Synechococcus sp. J7-Johnson]